MIKERRFKHKKSKKKDETSKHIQKILNETLAFGSNMRISDYR